MSDEQSRKENAVYVREVGAERWLNVTVSVWLAGAALLAAGWATSAALQHAGPTLLRLLRLSP